jgi:hypothetical protein
MHYCQSPLRSGCQMRVFQDQPLNTVSVGTAQGSWSWKQGGGLEECDKKRRWKVVRLESMAPALGKLQGPEGRDEGQHQSTRVSSS